MRHSPAEKMEIIHLVEGSDLPVRQTLRQLQINRSTFYRWYARYREDGYDGLADTSSNPRQLWNRIPDDIRKLVVDVALDQPLPADARFELRFRQGDRAETIASQAVNRNAIEFLFDVKLPNARLWSLDDPYLYEVEAVLKVQGVADRVSTYFGMRKISVGDLPGTDIPYVMLNNKPVYLIIYEPVVNILF